MQQDTGRETRGKMREDKSKTKGNQRSQREEQPTDRIGLDRVGYSVCEETPGVDLFGQQDHLQ